MFSFAVSYGENGHALCALVPDGSHLVRCFGIDASIAYGTPYILHILSLTAGDSFVCGLLLDSNQPYSWGSNLYVEMGVPQPMDDGATYSQISAGDHHLRGIRKPRRELQSTASVPEKMRPRTQKEKKKMSHRAEMCIASNTTVV
ncbi:putative receptor protein kinase CRINKLY4 [Platanthera zijinensis]|uniref:non-specific serine/threonine protein kinase n=1 Tax=Platanthera zijinensis TaxID=2320716 RepID=A0AAP0G3E8_9ASPA